MGMERLRHRSSLHFGDHIVADSIENRQKNLFFVSLGDFFFVLNGSAVSLPHHAHRFHADAFYVGT